MVKKQQKPSIFSASKKKKKEKTRFLPKNNVFDISFSFFRQLGLTSYEMQLMKVMMNPFSPVKYVIIIKSGKKKKMKCECE